MEGAEVGVYCCFFLVARGQWGYMVENIFGGGGVVLTVEVPCSIIRLQVMWIISHFGCRAGYVRSAGVDHRAPV